MKMRAIHICFLIILLFSCKGEQDSDSPYTISVTHISNIGNLKFNGELLNPTSIIKQDSFFIICDIGTDTFFHIYSANTYNLITKIGYKGNGPEDFVNPTMMDINTSNKTLFTFDSQLKLYREYKLSELFNNKFENTISCRLPLVVSQAIPFGDYFITIGAFEKNMYGICKGDSIIKTLFEYPGNIALSDFKKSFIFNGKIRIRPDQTGFVYAGLYSDVIEIFKIEKTNGIKKIKEMYSYLPEYIDKSTDRIFKVNVKKDIPNGFNDVVCTNKYIYAIYNGRTSIEYGYNHCWSNQIYVLDWTGNMIKKIILDKDIWTFCIDDKENKIYTISPSEKEDDETMTFYIYDLKNIL